jgi:glycosyltransferase involved in cell wall biosynthesis
MCAQDVRPRTPYSERMSKIVVINGIGDAVVAFRGTLVRDLVARGHEVVVSTPLPQEVDPDVVRSEVTALGARCVFSPLDRTSMNPLRERAACKYFDRLLTELRPDAVFASNPKPIFYAIPAAARIGVARRVAMVTGLGFAFTGHSLRAQMLKVAATRLYRKACSDATAIIFQNDDDRAELAARGSLPDSDAQVEILRCAGSGVDLEAFPAHAVPDGPPVFLMVARLLRDKGVREFVAAARKVRAVLPDVRFRLVGWIDENPSAIRRTELERWINAGDIEFAGRLTDVRPELAHASVFVLPSYREGTPKSTLEALATGRAVITTDAPGCRETVRHGVNGLLVPVGDAEALAEACLRLAREPHMVRTMGRASRELAEDVFAAEHVHAVIRRALGVDA